MAHGFIDETLDGFNHQQINFAAKIGGYTFDKVEAGDILEIKADAKYLSWEIATRSLYISYGQSWTTSGDILFHGPDAGIDAVAPPLPTIDTMPAVVHPGMRNRFSEIAANCKKSTGYTEAMGIDLGIVAVITPFVPANGKPVVKSELHVGHPFFRYPKGGYEGAQMYKDSSDGHGFLKFDKAINPTYTDNTPLPAAGVAVVWKYKFVYLYGGVEVGTASDVVEVLVTGM